MINMIWAAIGALGFSLIFNVKENKILYCTISGFINYLVYYIAFSFTNNIFISNAIGAFFTLIYSNIMANVLKCPSTIFLLPGLIPSVPGSSIFYMMQSLVISDNNNASIYGMEACKVILGIIIGLAVASMLFVFIKKIIKRKKKKHH